MRMAGNSAGRTVSNRPSARSRRGGGGQVEAKIILLGDSAVGKSSIALRFCQDRFDEVHDVTIGGAYLQKVISIQNPENPAGADQQVKMHIWDTGGHERFRSMINMYYRDAIGAIICYDLTNEQSFKSVEYWVREMKENTTAD